MKPFPWILTLCVVPALILLLVLGVWQVQRMGWKEGLISAATDAAARPPAPLSEVLTASNPEFRRALVVCPGLMTAPYVELQSIIEGQGGQRLISICHAQGQVFLIDRGFVADAVTTRPGVAPSSLPLSLMVELRRTPGPGMMSPPPSEGRFYARDSQAIARALGADRPSEYTLFALSSSNPEMPELVASAPPPFFANNHLGYALTWFGLAIALIGFYLAMLRQGLKQDRDLPRSKPAKPREPSDKDKKS